MAEKTVAKNEPSPLAQFAAKRAALDNEATLPGRDEALSEWIQSKLSAILNAGDFETINALMTETGLTPSKTLVGRTFEIRDFALSESADAFREKSALQKFCIVKAVDVSDGEEFIIDGGGDMFVAGLVAMRDRYDFPFTGTLLAKTTGSGYDMLYWKFFDPKRKPVS